MTVRRNQHGTWTVDITFTHADGHVQRIRKASPIDTRRGAEEYERQVRANVLAGTYRLPREEVKEERSKVPTLATFVKERWLPVYPAAANNRACTVKEKRWALNHHILPAVGHLQLDQIDDEEVSKLAATMTDKKLNSKSVKNVLSVLRTLLTSAVEWKVIPALPRFPKIKVSESEFEHYSTEESQRLIDGTKTDEDRAVLMFALHTGVRAGELAALEWGDLDLKKGEVTISRNRPVTLRQTGPTKSGRSRHIPLTASLATALKRIRHLRGPLVFCKPDGKHLESWDLHGIMEAACRRAGVRKVRWHDMRHTFASQAVEAGVPLNVVQQWMGHSTIAMTMRYAHLAPDGGARWIRALEEAASGNLAATADVSEVN